ncbi:abnormal spindle-like microcephaly-associated protein homolog [Anopheles bellator]|uniref:abnormal spindle-like microcephaly-associated protein homolog n=1 Tax=Anopheles bellator TaxID=139047 RepID=UPI002648816A|nr:abnormal spindle-like microcephaly-associated protein homolog [Anopheles bellator]
MNFLLHQQRSPGAVVPIPEDLRGLMEDMSHEVLRAQPKKVIHFLADYLEEKLVRRENRRLAERVVDNVLDHSVEIVAMLEAVGFDADRAELAVKRIRQEFHRHFETRTDDERLREAFREREVLDRLIKECHFSETEARQASAIIEQAYRTFYFRNAYRDPHAPDGGANDWRQAAKHSLAIFAETGPTREEMETAAIRIQAAYRGYYTRKRQELDRKATIIQRAFRRHQHLKEVSSEILAYEVLQPVTSASELSYSPSDDVRRLVNVAVSRALSAGERPPETPNMKQAATLIQSVYRGHRQRVQRGLGPKPQPGPDLEAAATLLQSVIRGHQTRKKAKTYDAMATLLQSHARGYLARKRFPHSTLPADNS